MGPEAARWTLSVHKAVARVDRVGSSDNDKMALAQAAFIHPQLHL
jgi:hypothetical protein